MTNISQDVSTEAKKVEATIQADLAKTYSGKIVLGVFAAGLIFGAILKAIF